MTDAQLTDLIHLNRAAAIDPSGHGAGRRQITGAMILDALKARGGEFRLPDGRTAFVSTDGLGVLWYGWLGGIEGVQVCRHKSCEASSYDQERARAANRRRYGPDRGAGRAAG